MTAQIDFDEIRHEEMQADFERAAEWTKRESQRCVSCKNALWIISKNGSSRTFLELVPDPIGLGVCVLNGDCDGITMADNALTMDCDGWQAVDR